MSNIAVFNKNLVYLERFDYYSYLAFRYHYLFFKSLIFRGNKLRAFSIYCNIKLRIKLREKTNPFWVILIALLKITPDCLVYPLKLGGQIQKVPLPISPRKQYTFAVKWVIKVMKEKHGSFTVRNLTDTLISALYGKGPAMEKKKSVYESTILNRHLIKFFKF